MIGLDFQKPRVYLKKCAEFLCSDQETDHCMAKEALKALKDLPDSSSFKQIAYRFQKSRSIEEVVVGRYALFQLGQCAENKLFPYNLSNKRGSIRDKDYIPEQDQEDDEVEGEVQDPGFVINIPMYYVPRHAPDNKVNQLVQKIMAQSYGKEDDFSRTRIAKRVRVVIGCNRYRSIDKSLNRAFKEAINGLQPVTYAKVFGFFWDPAWEEETNPVKLKRVKQYYTVLHRLDACAARKIRESLEKSIGNSQVPYQHLRERLKNHQFTKASFASLAQIAPDRPLFLAIMDADVVSLRTDGRGLFSHYNQLIRENSDLAIGSTGYQFSLDKYPLLYWGGKLDQAVRQAMGKVFPLSPYFPEPNMIILKLPSTTTIRESFVDPKSDAQESRIIMRDVIRSRNLTNEIVFTSRGGVVTTIPERFKTMNADREVDGQTVRTKLTLKSFRGVRQSSIKPLSWAKAIASCIGIEKEKLEMCELNAVLTRIFNQFDPVHLAKTQYTGRYNQHFYDHMMATYESYTKSLCFAVRLFRDHKELREDFVSQGEVQAILDKAAKKAKELLNLSKNETQNYFSLYLGRLDVLIENGVKKLIDFEITEDTAFNVVRAARLSGAAMVGVLEEIGRL